MSSMQPFKLTCIVGCTGTGKGALGRELARCNGGEIVSLDSMKVFRRMDIATAKPSAQIRREIPHHVIDVVDPHEDFSVAQFVRHAEEAIREIALRGHPIFVTGGTPLYLKALMEGLFEGPEASPAIRRRLQEEAGEQGLAALHQRLQQVDAVAAGRIHPHDARRIVRALEVFELTGTPISALQQQWDRQRTRYDCTLIGLRREREDQNHRTNRRVRSMMDAGLVDEVRALLHGPRPLSPTARQALGYAEVLAYLQGEASLAETIEMIKIHTRQFAKAQRTWFKRFSSMNWMDLDADSSVAEMIDTVIERVGKPWSA